MTVITTPSRTLLKAQRSKSQHQKDYARHAERLGQFTASQESKDTGSTRAVRAEFITPQDPIIRTANDGRLPAVPLEEALELNALRDAAHGKTSDPALPQNGGVREAKDGTVHGAGPGYRSTARKTSGADSEQSASLGDALAPSRTNPLFPPLPLYGPPTLLRALHCRFFRLTSFFLSLGFLLCIILGAVFTSIPDIIHYVWMRATLRDPLAHRPFRQEERQSKRQREAQDREWVSRKRRPNRRYSRTDDATSEKSSRLKPAERGGRQTPSTDEYDLPGEKASGFIPTEGGPDPLICDVAYYARREGLDIEEFSVQTEDGFIIDLHHVYDPRTQQAASVEDRQPHAPSVFHSSRHNSPNRASPHRASPNRGPQKLPEKYPVLLMHGLLQSSGAYCCSGPSSLAFYLAKAGYDVWLGNNRCGFKPRHTMLGYSDPRMWAWNIRQMGVMDLSALVARVLAHTGSPKLALVAHSQGTTQTLVALAKEQRPELGRKISVFCALAPAAYAGPLVGKSYFKFMRILTPNMFKCVFGIHSFIPFMMTMHRLLPAKFYGDMGYLVFSFLFNWSDLRWDRGLRGRYFQFSPTYVSAESMRWWLGRDCFAKQRCILSTREEGSLEDKEDEEEDGLIRQYYENGRHTSTDMERDLEESRQDLQRALLSEDAQDERGKYAWYDDNFPPLALWVAGADDLVDGRRLLRRFDRGREPRVRVVHKKIIEGYEHLDVIWAMDSIEKVGSEVKEIIWRTLPPDSRDACEVPDGCHDLTQFNLDSASDRNDSVRHVIKDGIQELSRDLPVKSEVARGSGSTGPISPTQVDASAGGSTEDQGIAGG